MFAGARTDVPTWLAAADVVVVPSRWEGMALVPLEAMACARSVVATDVNGVVDSVPADAGRSSSSTTGRPGRCAGRRLADPALAEDEGWRGRSHVETHHDVTTSARELARVYCVWSAPGAAADPDAVPPGHAAGGADPAEQRLDQLGQLVEPGAAQQPPDRADPARDGHRPRRARAGQCRARRVRNRGTVVVRPRSSIRGWRPARRPSRPGPAAPAARRRAAGPARVTRATRASISRLTARTGATRRSGGGARPGRRRPARGGGGRAPAPAGSTSGRRRRRRAPRAPRDRRGLVVAGRTRSATTTASTPSRSSTGAAPAAARAGPAADRGPGRGCWPAPVPTNPTGRARVGPGQQGQREPSGGGAGPDDQHRAPEPPATPQQVRCRRRRGCARGPGRPGRARRTPAPRRPALTRTTVAAAAATSSPGRSSTIESTSRGRCRSAARATRTATAAARARAAGGTVGRRPGPATRTAATSATVSAGPIVPNHGTRRRTRATTDSPQDHLCRRTPQ